MARIQEILGRGQFEQALLWLLLGLLAIGCLLVLRPFFSPILWAIILGYSTWPIYERLNAALGNRGTLAAFLMTLGLAAAFVLPLVLLGTSLADNVETLVEALRGPDGGIDFIAPPSWVKGLPLVGETLDAYWLLLVTNTGQFLREVGSYLAPLFGAARNLVVAGGVGLGRGVLELSLSVLIVFFVYRDGHKGRRLLVRGGERVMGPGARRLIGVAAGTIRGVVYGVVGTAALQGALAAIGFALAGVPAPVFLGCLVFVLSLFPVGAPLVWVPAVLWLLHQGSIGWAIFLAVWGAGVVSTVDNFVRPWLISRGSNLPFLLGFIGVLGGLVAFGLLGIFLGPTLLAVALALVREWLAMRPGASPEGDVVPKAD